MTPKLAEVERKAVQLPPKDREKLAGRLIESLAEEPLTDVEEAWVKEAERRFGAYRRGVDPATDDALDRVAAVEAFLRQPREERAAFDDTKARLSALFTGTGQPRSTR